MKSLSELGAAVRELIPNAVWEKDNDGQWIIYTNLWTVYQSDSFDDIVIDADEVDYDAE